MRLHLAEPPLLCDLSSIRFISKIDYPAGYIYSLYINTFMIHFYTLLATTCPLFTCSRPGSLLEWFRFYSTGYAIVL